MRNQDGFTLIEMMVTLAISAIMITSGVPAFQHIVQTNRQAAQSAMLVRALQFARTEAIRRAANVTVCSGSATGGHSGKPVCSKSRDWSNGWIVFIDNHGGAGDFNKDDKLLHVFPALDAGATLTSDLGTGRFDPKDKRPIGPLDLKDPKGPGKAGASFVSYTSTGLSSTSGYFTLCDGHGSGAATAINVSPTGAVHTGIDSGTALTCS
jgi:type IV fimbrial biogenesis protein FimT